MDEQLEQRTADWLKFRQTRIGSSDACIILGTVDWSTPRDLFFEKKNIKLRKSKKSFNNKAMDLGNEFEEKARALYELLSGLDFVPKILVSEVHPWRIASLDGFNASNGKRIVLEIKCSQGDEVFLAAKSGLVHEKYMPQVQHQLDVAKADFAVFFVCKLAESFGRYFIEEYAYTTCYPDPAFQADLLIKEQEFYDCLKFDSPPPLTRKDYMYADDQKTLLLFSKIKEAKRRIEDLQNEENQTMSHVANLLNQIQQAKLEFDTLKAETIGHIETELKHNKIFALGVSFNQNVKGVWSVRVDTSDDSEGPL